jgi:hypothetical protein
MRIVEDVEQWVKQAEEHDNDEYKLNGLQVSKIIITQDYCSQIFDEITSKFEEYERN